MQTGVIEGTDRESVRVWADVPEDGSCRKRYCFDPPVSPHLAAREAGVRIALDSFEFPPAPHDRPWIVEGAGGVMVPLNERDLMLDLMRHLGLPVIVAARTALGTINHTLLTLAALRSANLDIRGVVLIGAENIENRAPSSITEIFASSDISLFSKAFIAPRCSMCLRHNLTVRRSNRLDAVPLNGRKPKRRAASK